MAECETKDCSENECLGKDTPTGQFQVVDYGDQLLRDVEEMRDELLKQCQSLCQAQKLLWEVVRTLIVLILPVTAALLLTAFSHTFLPATLDNALAAIFLAASVGFVLLNLPQLNDAVSAYLAYKVYTPCFTECKCETCAGKVTQSGEQEGAGDSSAIPQDVGKDPVGLGTLTTEGDTRSHTGNVGQVSSGEHEATNASGNAAVATIGSAEDQGSTTDTTISDVGIAESKEANPPNDAVTAPSGSEDSIKVIDSCSDIVD